MGLVDQIGRVFGYRIVQSGDTLFYDVLFDDFFDAIYSSIFYYKVVEGASNHITMKSREREGEDIVRNRVKFVRGKNNKVNIDKFRIGFEYRDKSGGLVLIRSPKLLNKLKVGA